MTTFTTKNLIIAGLYVALLIVAQLALSALAGVEVVTVLLLAFCFVRGVKQGVVVATAFSLIRCFVFGFMPNVLVLYLLYYNLFALSIGFLGRVCKHKYSLSSHALAVVLTICLTAFFTLLDCIITPLMYAFSYKAANAYFFASIPVVFSQTICTLATSILLFFPLTKVLQEIK